jgi:hypothetical protein
MGIFIGIGKIYRDSFGIVLGFLGDLEGIAWIYGGYNGT